MHFFKKLLFHCYCLPQISKKHRDGEPLSQVALQELQAKYKPLHPALKNAEALQLYYRKLAQMILHHYLPVEVTRCDLILLSLRDLFAQNVLQAFVDLLCDTQWLNTVLAEILTGVSGEEVDEGENVELSGSEKSQCQNDVYSNITELTQVSDRVPGYMNLLASIKEETLSDLQECDHSCVPLTQSKDSGNNSFDRCSLPEGLSSDKEKFENAEALVEYVRTSSLEKKDSKEDDEYKTVSSALGTLISTTAGPLLPDYTSPLSYQPLVTKMWESPVEDKCFVEAPAVKKKKNPFSRNVVEGMKEEDYKLMYNPVKGDKSSFDSVASAEEDILVESDALGRTTTTNIEIRVEESECPENASGQPSLPPSLCDMPRSKSCGSLVNKDKEVSTLKSETKKLHGSLNELDNSGDFALSEKSPGSEKSIVGEDDLGSRKEKGHLVKMLSFDKNDGTDEASLKSNKLSTEGSFKIKNLSSDSSDFKCKNGDNTDSNSTVVGLEPKEGEIEPPNSLEIPNSPIDDAGFGWENPDLSPIYEESEDLASSIAKLR